MAAYKGNPDIMNVKEIIEVAFGDYEGNAVNFKLVQTVLFLIARQLRLLERRVEVDFSRVCAIPSGSSLSVTEVKIHAMQKKTKKAKYEGDKGAGGARVNVGGVGGVKTSDGKGQMIGKTSDKASADKTSPEQTSTDKTSTDKTSSSDKTSGEKEASSRKSSPQGLASDKTKTSSKAGKEPSKKAGKQRADSFEEAEKSPAPMTTLDATEEAQYEKLLVVERVPSTESKRSANVQDQKGIPQISVVTQEQFERLAEVVHDLQKRLLPIGTPQFPERGELMQELRRGASLTDAMAALQLSARLESTEKALQQMISMVTELAKQTPGMKFNSKGHLVFEGPVTPLETYGATHKGPEEHDGHTFSKSQEQEGTLTTMTMSTVESSEMPLVSQPVRTTAEDSQFAMNPDYITYQQLKIAAAEIYDNVINTLKTLTTRTTANAEQAYKLSLYLENKIDAALNVASRMSDLENLVKQYADQINAVDTGLSSQMTNYQEQLTQMQHDLEVGLDSMAEVLGNTGGDTAAVSELNSHFTSLQLDFDNMMYQQKDLKDAQDSIAFDLEGLWKEIEMLRDTKSDREEVADALRDKAGIGELNGLVSLQQFDAVRGDFEMRTGQAYDKFNNQEFVWQKAIDDLVRDLNEKVDLVQIESLKIEINKYLNIMKDRMQEIMDIVGEPKSAIVSKKLFRDTTCLSCGSPAHMDEKEPVLVPALPRFPSGRQPGEGAGTESKGDGDHKMCYNNFPIPHPIDPRSHICNRYCGGSHTLVTEGPSRVPPSMVVQQPLRRVNTERGTDGKTYLVDEPPEGVPCLPCNIPKPKLPSNPDNGSQQAPQAENAVNEITFSRKVTMVEFDNISVTPPACEVPTLME